MNDKGSWSGWHTFSLLIIVIALVFIGLRVPMWSRLTAWIFVIILLLLFCLIAGQGITGRWIGLLIDERKSVSLSRLQLVLWTIIVLSGFFCAALSNVAAGASDPLSIAVPEQLWILMGISTTSLIGSPLVRSPKRHKEPKVKFSEVRFTIAKERSVDEDDLDSRGLIVYNKKVQQAQWSDIFAGEEVDNAGLLDLGKVQMFYFTLILVLVYLINMGSIFNGAAPIIDALPPLSERMIALLGISHAGYLVYKAVPHSQTA